MTETSTVMAGAWNRVRYRVGMLAVVPGTLVAAVITISAPGTLLGSIETGDPREVAYMLVAFPFPIWGPLLGAAVFAYWLRRTEGSVTARTI